MIVPPDKVILLRRTYIKLQTEMDIIKKEMQEFCDHDLVVECGKYRVCEICGKKEYKRDEYIPWILGDRAKQVSERILNETYHHLEDIQFLTSDERPVKDVIE